MEERRRERGGSHARVTAIKTLLPSQALRAYSQGAAVRRPCKHGRNHAPPCSLYS